MSDLNTLFSPIVINNTEIPNRAVLPPMGTGLCEKGGRVNDALLAYLRRQARGGAGLLISEITAVHPTGMVSPKQVAAWDDEFIPGLSQMAEAMKSNNGKAAMQLHHAGRESLYMIKKQTAMGPSAVPSLVYGQAPREMTREDIAEIVSAFGAAAARAQKAGFDAVEIHGAHGYLLTQFLSAISNQRTDEYGGSFKNRARFVTEVVRAVRNDVGKNFPVLLRISVEEYIKGGYTVEDVLGILPDLKEAGVDVIHASIGTHGSPAGVTSAPPAFDVGFNVGRARQIKDAAGLPVIAVGRFNDPRPADKVIADGDADLVAFGRQQLCDPDFLEKARQNRYADIRKCIACNQGCIEREMFEGKSVRCAINPETGQELVCPQQPAADPKTVWIVGSGPAGLIAASEAKRLGHDVRLFEKKPQAGGNILYACKAPHKEIYLDWIQWQADQVEKAGVKIETNTCVTADMIADAQPDQVILALGGEKIIPKISRIDLPHVYDAWQILGETTAPGKNALVIGGGLIGMETACFLAAKGASVTLAEQMESSPVPKFTSHGYSLHKYLKEKQCVLRFGAAVEKITENKVVLKTKDQSEEVPGFDQVVLAVGMKPRNGLSPALEKAGIAHTVVGDALEVRRIMEAVEEGAAAVWQL
ncbi:MAG: FAD-dependent oxidoreductase [Desulfosalsimonas sp.]|uniref:oxidoreductase n=1 Tax=Desulfosalsimonas sp. TaxID=3073848 RepID=UPI0039706334